MDNLELSDQMTESLEDTSSTLDTSSIDIDGSISDQTDQNPLNKDGSDVSYSLLQALELTKAYDDTIAVNSINFTTSAQSLGILGPNGCGKSTFLKLLLNLIKPTKGSITLNPAIKDIRVIPDYPKLPVELTVDEWIEILAKFHGQLIQDVDVQTKLGLKGFWKLKELSAGQYRKAALLPAFFGSPELLILDEPTNFLDIVTREYVLQLLLKQIHDKGSRVIIASHRVNEIRLLADQAIILKNGSMLKSVNLVKQPIRSFEIVVDQEDAFREIMKENGIMISSSRKEARKVFEIPNIEIVWKALFSFTSNSGTIISFRGVDELDKNIEELLR